MKKLKSVVSKDKVLKKEVSRLKKMNEELDRFVYSASHDLKAPLRSIMGIINIAQSESKDPKQLEYMGMIFRSTMKLDNFINDLVNFSRNTRTEIKRENIDFFEIISETLENLSHMDAGETLHVTSEIEREPFFSDSRRLKIIFSNLISNSIKYQDKNKKTKPKLNIKVHINDKKALLTFSDNGEGIAKENHKKIFNMFFRASEQSQGSGLGLFIVHGMIKKLGGTIRVESSPGVGTTFSISIPNSINSINT